LKLDISAIHATPPANITTQSPHNSRSDASARVTTANTAVAPATSRSTTTRCRTFGRTKAPAIAPAPIDPKSPP
jgi:hypothetical protein